MSAARPGIRENLPQFTLLVLVNALVGGMIGLERTLLPALAEDELGLTRKLAVLAFIGVFGLTKALTNYGAGGIADRWGRKPALVAGWIVALPVPFLLMGVDRWEVLALANVLLGVSQGLTWSTTVVMKIDLAGARHRGLAMGLNEFAGYLAVGLTALATGALAARFGPTVAPFWLGVVFAGLGLAASLLLVKETRGMVALESAAGSAAAPPAEVQAGEAGVFVRTSFHDPTLSSACQAGLVNNLNDGVAWGLFPLLFASAGMGVGEIGVLVALYPVVWGLGQLIAGAASDHIGRKGLLVLGMLTQAAGLGVTATAAGFSGFAAGSVLLGVGTAMVYPTLLATVADGARAPERARAVGTYRLWRDGGYVVGAIFAGLLADRFGLEVAVLATAALTAGSGLTLWRRMPGAARATATQV
jgi:MFS family permease